MVSKELQISIIHPHNTALGQARAAIKIHILNGNPSKIGINRYSVWMRIASQKQY